MVMTPPLRVAFFGTPAFAVPTLEALLASRHSVVVVVTQPDRPRGRGQRTTDAPVKTVATAAHLPVLQPSTMKDDGFLASLAGFDLDLGVVAAYGRILTERMLAIPRHGMINVHASLLPRYRGAAPVHRAVIAGDLETGVTIMRVVKALDAGAMMATVTRPIDPDETSAEVERDLARLGAALLVSTLDTVGDLDSAGTPQDDTQASYARRLTKEDGIVDWSQSAEQVHNLIRGLYPWPHAYTFANGRRLILLRSRPQPERGASAEPGTIVEAAGDHLAVATGAGVLEILQIQAEGKRPMTVREFLAGHRIAPGDHCRQP
jgi:methionyl-tRNA formyltransferase